jgi:hypothetical protein
MSQPIRCSEGFLRRILAVVAAALVVGCGGGGGNNAPSTLQVLLKDGDVLPGNFTIATVESANMANDRTVALIASQPGTPALNGVFLRSPGGDVTTILSPASTTLPDSVSLTRVSKLAMSANGDFSFDVGGQLDSDAVFLYANQTLSIAAQTDPGSTPPGFRILGERRVANGGLIAFSDGTSPCTVDDTGSSERINCTLRVFLGNAGGVSQLALPVSLDNQSTDGVSVIMNNATGKLSVGLPAKGRQSLVGFVENGQYQSLINRQDVIPGLGTVLSADPRAIGSSGSLAINARFDTDGDGVIDKDRVLLYANGQITSLAETGVPAGSKIVQKVDARDVDANDRVLFAVTFGDPGSATGNTSVRISEGGVAREIAFEGQSYGQDDKGNDEKILQIGTLRLSEGGDVVFVASLGNTQNGTTQTTETRILRDAGAGLETVLKTGTSIPGTGSLVQLEIADINDAGDILSIVGVNRKTNRALVLVPR